ncbi:MAG: hypothetical protein APF80_17470 [Alphaproteobacteria bacterium BRH_c36]|nr:MAG: hypothetical protein APF80_17470 [Alphaproteobacteria bacterium BRH_c36]
MSENKRRRKPQFQRSKDQPIRITKDDLSVLRLVGESRFLRTQDIHRELPHRSRKHLTARTRRLYDHGYLDRPRAQVHEFTGFGRPDTIHALGNKGAALLAELDGEVPAKSNWTDKNRSVKRPHIQHTLRISDIKLAINRLPRHVPAIKILSADDILKAAPPTTAADRNPWQWQARVRTKDGSVKPTKAIPDDVFGIDRTDVRKRYYYFVECDRGTMPIARTKQQSSHIVRKFEAYFHGFQAQLHRTRYNCGNLRFLTVTTSQERIANMITALQDIAEQADCSMFLFADFNQIMEAQHIMEVPWLNGHREQVSLLDCGTAGWGQLPFSRKHVATIQV